MDSAAKNQLSIGTSKPRSWQEVLAGSDRGDLQQLISTLKKSGAGVESLTSMDWDWLLDVAETAREIAGYEGSYEGSYGGSHGRRRPDDREVLKGDIVRQIITQGLCAEATQTRWSAWMTLWRLDKRSACMELLTEPDWARYAAPKFPSGSLKTWREKDLGRIPRALVSPDGVALKPLMCSEEKVDRELAMRFMGALRRAKA